MYFLSDFPEQLGPVWSFLPCEGTDKDKYDPCELLKIDGSQVQNLQKSVNAHASEFDIISKLQSVGNDFRVARQRKLLVQSEMGDLKKGIVESSIRSSSLVTMRVIDKKTPPQKGGKSKTPSKVPLKSALKKSRPVSILPLDSPLAKSRIVGTVSKKLTYLMNKILEHYKTEKILIFFEDGDVAWYIAQALEILGIEHLWYSGKLIQERRATHLSVFQNSEKYRVLLMDLNQAAHGLNVSCASRVFFVNPVWRRDIEQQAMKRAHRIGQTRTVYVETLILVGTIEEAMWKRRGAMTEKERDGAKGGLLEDSKMRDIISNLKFLRVEPGEVAGIHQVSMLTAPEPIFGEGKHGGVYDDIEHVRLSSLTTSAQWGLTAAGGEADKRVTSDLPAVASVPDEPVRSDLLGARVRWMDETSPRGSEASSRKRKSPVTHPAGHPLHNSESSGASTAAPVEGSAASPALSAGHSPKESLRSIKRRKKFGFKAGDDRDWMEDSDDDFGQSAA